MPFTLHEDTLSTYIRSSNLVMDGEISFSITNAVPHLVQSAWLFLVKPLMPTFNSFFDIPVNSLTGQPEIYKQMLSDPYIMWYAFLFKLPYLFFEIGFFFMIWKTFSGSFRKKYLSRWLWCVPIIYIAYLFGRFEPIALFFLACVFYCIKRQWYVVGLVPFAFILMTRISFALLLPVYILMLWKYDKHFWKYAPYGAVVGIILIYFLNGTIIHLGTSKFALYYLTLLFEHIFIPLFPIVYILILYFAFSKHVPKVLPAFAYFGFFSGLIFIAQFMFTYWNIQYLAWMLPFVVYFSFKSRRLTQMYYVFLVIFILAIFANGYYTTTLLFAPINYDYFWSLTQATFGIHERLFAYVGIFGRILMSIILTFFAFNVLRLVPSIDSYVKKQYKRIQLFLK